MELYLRICAQARRIKRGAAPPLFSSALDLRKTQVVRKKTDEIEPQSNEGAKPCVIQRPNLCYP